MDLQLILLVLAALALALLASMVFLRRRRAPAPPAAAADAEAPTEVATRPRRRRRLLTPAGALVVLLPLLILAAGAWLFTSQANSRSTDRFVVLVAPFADSSDGQTGQNVAEALAREIGGQVRGQVSVRVIGQRPADASEALSIAAAEQSDVLIWGSVEPGAILDSKSLSPQLTYTPNGAYAPMAWAGYQGRFAMPSSYTLAGEPINGKAVLPTLVGALYDYGGDQPDRAVSTLNRLVSDYPELSPALPHALLGNLRWARGSYAEAADAYRLALAQPSAEQALLANNLGAILLDAGDPGVLSAFQEAVRLLEKRDLGALRYNLGLLAMNDQRPGDAVLDLEQARNLLPASAPLLLSLADAYRESGRLGSATAAIDAAAQQSQADLRQVPAIFRPMVSQRLSAAVSEQRGMLGLARLLNAQAPLAWELEVADPLPEKEVAALGSNLRDAVTASEQASARWHQRSASDSAADPATGQVAGGQADQAAAAARRQRYELAIINTELARAQASKPVSAVGQMWGALFGASTPVGESLSLLDSLAQLDPNSPQVLLARGRALRVAGQLNEADRTYDQLIQVAAQRPEGYFGKGEIARERGDSATAAQLMRLAIERNGAFFPARMALAALDQAGGDIASAVVQLRAVAQLRPGPDAAIPLAQALRLSGPGGYLEAEQVLLPLTSTSAAAWVELGRLYNDADRPDAAISAYRSALTIDPRNSTAAFELGERLAAAGQLEAAEQALSDALRFDGDNTAARLALAQIYLHEGPLKSPEQADKQYAIALGQGVRDLSTLIAIGDAALKNANPGQAIDAYGQATRLAPNEPLPQYKLAQAYLITNRLQSAADAAQIAVNQTTGADDPAQLDTRARALVILGEVARRKGDLPRANDLYTQARQIDPQLIGAQLGIGLVAVGQGQWGVALSYFETATVLPGGGSDPQAQFWLAEGLLRSGDLPRATAAYSEALNLQPTFPEALLGQAQVQHAQGNTAGALTMVNSSLAQRGDYAEALLFKGKLLQEQGDSSGAMDAYNESIRANGQIAEAHYRRGLLLISAEKYDQAISDMRQAAALQQNFPEANYWMGRAYYARLQLQSAHDAFKRAVDLNATYSEAQYYLGLASEDLGLRDEAISAYQGVIITDSGEWAARAREQLNRIQ